MWSFAGPSWLESSFPWLYCNLLRLSCKLPLDPCSTRSKLVPQSPRSCLLQLTVQKHPPWGWLVGLMRPPHPLFFDWPLGYLRGIPLAVHVAPSKVVLQPPSLLRWLPSVPISLCPFLFYAFFARFFWGSLYHHSSTTTPFLFVVDCLAKTAITVVCSLCR